jgi:hypothetical protein
MVWSVPPPKVRARDQGPIASGVPARDLEAFGPRQEPRQHGAVWLRPIARELRHLERQDQVKRDTERERRLRGPRVHAPLTPDPEANRAAGDNFSRARHDRLARGRGIAEQIRPVAGPGDDHDSLTGSVPDYASSGVR